MNKHYLKIRTLGDIHLWLILPGFGVHCRNFYCGIGFVGSPAAALSKATTLANLVSSLSTRYLTARVPSLLNFMGDT
jgi:hypothetical protein